MSNVKLWHVKNGQIKKIIYPYREYRSDTWVVPDLEGNEYYIKAECYNTEEKAREAFEQWKTRRVKHLEKEIESVKSRTWERATESSIDWLRRTAPEREERIKQMRQWGYL